MLTMSERQPTRSIRLVPINQARKYPAGIYGPPPRPVHARPGLTRLVAAPGHPCPGLTRPIFIGRVNNEALERDAAKNAAPLSLVVMPRISA
jgi:hypothetical protein